MSSRPSFLMPFAGDHPLRKRLISLLPYLAYSSLRFAQAREWQLQVFPELCGGIPSRSAAPIYNHIAINALLAKQEQRGFSGIQVDQSKCFDRVIPQVAADLLVRLGLPRSLVRVWLSLYRSFSRHLTWGRWCTPAPLVGVNGIAQGDSLSIMTVNGMMGLWVRVMHAPRCSRFGIH